MRTKSQLIKPCSESGLLSPFYIDNRNQSIWAAIHKQWPVPSSLGLYMDSHFTLVSHVFLNAQFNQALLFSVSRYTGEMISFDFITSTGGKMWCCM